MNLYTRPQKLKKATQTSIYGKSFSRANPSISIPENATFEIKFADGSQLVNTASEFQLVTVQIVSTNVPSGAELTYKITGVSPTDINVPLTGVITLVNNYHELPIFIEQDNIAEGSETLTFTLLGTNPTASASITINED